MRWPLVFAIVAATTLSDLLQSHAMRRGGRAWKLPAAIFFMAVSFFAFTQLLKSADLSFAAPVSAATLATETVCARLILRERVTMKRWTGALLVAAGVWLIAL
jgi:drug/metabolite transporter (DMT)-like permease